MRVCTCIGGCNWDAKEIRCETSETKLGVDTWKLIKPIPLKAHSQGDVHGIHIKHNPLDQLKNDCSEEAKRIMDHLFMLARRWLDRDSIDPIDVDSAFQMTTDGQAPQAVDKEIVSVLLHYVDIVCTYNVSFLPGRKKTSKGNEHDDQEQEDQEDWPEEDQERQESESVVGDLHLRWIAKDSDHDARYDGVSGISLNLEDQSCRSAFIRLMRSPGPFDGGDDYVFEKYMNVVISFLFQPDDVRWVNSDFTEVTPFPLVVLASNSSFDRHTQEEMALAAKQILENISKMEEDRGRCIEHKIVYGLHWDHLKLRIVAHFMNQPGYMSTSQWTFCQVVVAQHLITLPPDWDLVCLHTADDTFLDRWRITCALLSVRREIEHIRSQLQVQAHCLPNPSRQEPDEPLFSNENVIIPQDPHLNKLRQYWRGDSFYIPKEWMPNSPFQISIDEGLEKEVDYTRGIIPQLAKVLLKRIEHFLSPLTPQQVKANSKDPKYHGPDFIHSIHVPRSSFAWEVLGVDSKSTTEPHLTKVYDLLSLSVENNQDINIYIANTFADLSGYKVDYCPTGFRQPNMPQLSIDFALVLKQKGVLPLGDKPPVPLFFGIYLKAQTKNWYRLEDQTYQQLCQFLAESLQRINPDLHSPEEPRFLFCTAIASDYVHIFAAGPDNGIHHVDMIPINNGCDCENFLLSRMRLAMALFTLKRHVLALATNLGGDVEGRSLPDKL